MLLNEDAILQIVSNFYSGVGHLCLLPIQEL